MPWSRLLDGTLLVKSKMSGKLSSLNDDSVHACWEMLDV